MRNKGVIEEICGKVELKYVYFVAKDFLVIHARFFSVYLFCMDILVSPHKHWFHFFFFLHSSKLKLSIFMNFLRYSWVLKIISPFLITESQCWPHQVFRYFIYSDICSAEMKWLFLVVGCLSLKPHSLLLPISHGPKDGRRKSMLA